MTAMSAKKTSGRHRIRVFTGDCDLCRETLEIIEVGKCKDCKMERLAVDDPRNRREVERYGVIAVPTIVIDDRIKVVGMPDFPWFCGDEFYRKLEMEFPLTR